LDRLAAVRPLISRAYGSHIHLSNGQTEGPFALPLAKIRYTGEYQPGALMLQNDLFTENQSIYIVNVEHTAPATFDPDLSSAEGAVYNLLIPKPIEPYDISFYYAPLIPGDGQVMLVHVSSREATIAPAFDGSFAFLRIATQSVSLSFPLYHNENLIGSIEFTLGADAEPSGPGQFGNFVPVASPDYVFMVPGDRFTIKAPSTFDGGALGLAVTLAARTEQA